MVKVLGFQYSWPYWGWHLRTTWGKCQASPLPPNLLSVQSSTVTSHVMCQKCVGTNERTNLFFWTFWKTSSMFPLHSALFGGFVCVCFYGGFTRMCIFPSCTFFSPCCWVLCFIDVLQVFIIILEANKKILLLKNKQPLGQKPKTNTRGGQGQHDLCL